MRKFLLRRILLLIPVLWGVTTLVFIVTQVLPGDPVDLMLGETARPAQREQLRKTLGLDRPLGVQYADYMGGLLRGDLGNSLHQKRAVSAIIFERTYASAELTLASMAVALLISLPLGITAARRQGTALDLGAGFLAVAGASMPVFWLGPLLIIVFSIGLGWLPVSGREGSLSLILPAVTLGAALSPILMRMARSSLLEVLPQDYISAARAKGISEKRVLWLHALKNACLPLITILSLQLGALLSGAIITETVFAWPGVGRLVIQAIASRDYPLVQGCVLFIAAVYVSANFLADIAYAWLDPRVRLT
ncbi:MAG: ABC transporter permease [Nitrospinae bacterium]|nr:ABC transporter permease [Nitrospinota bacterium]